MTRRCSSRIRLRSRSQAGETLLTVMVAVVILATAALGAISLTGTLAMSAGRQAGNSIAGNAALEVAERIERADYQNCSTPSTFNVAAIVGNVRAGYVAEITSVRYINSTAAADSVAAWTAWNAALPCVPANDKGVIEVGFKVTAAAGKGGAATLTVIKRRSPLCTSIVGLVEPATPGERC